MTSCLFFRSYSPSKIVLLLKERICSQGSKLFPLSVDSVKKGGKTEIAIVASQESAPILLKLLCTVLPPSQQKSPGKTYNNFEDGRDHYTK